jgi:CRP/FNR family transcriptional regulator, cyclic AMP receptor protein
LTRMAEALPQPKSPCPSGQVGNSRLGWGTLQPPQPAFCILENRIARRGSPPECRLLRRSTVSEATTWRRALGEVVVKRDVSAAADSNAAESVFFNCAQTQRRPHWIFRTPGRFAVMRGTSSRSKAYYFLSRSEVTNIVGGVMKYFEIIGFIGAALMVATLAMKAMIPLRVVGIASNIFQIAFALSVGITPMLIQHGILLPVNAYRLYEQMRLVRKVRSASNKDLSLNCLVPFMTKRQLSAGQILFRKEDPAGEMFMVTSGRLRLREIAVDVLPGGVVGELGLLAPNQRRTQTLECIEDAEVMQISYDRVKSLYFENPSFGFYLLCLTSARLFQNIAKLEVALEDRNQEILHLKRESAPECHSRDEPSIVSTKSGRIASVLQPADATG